MMANMFKNCTISLTFESDESSGTGNETPDTSKPNKYLEKAKSFRKDGNQLFTTCSSEKDLQNVYSFYSKSIAHAPAKSREMALAYENLATLLFRLKKHTDCLQAIDSCLNSDYPEKLKFKIYLMQIECLKIIEEPVKAKKVYTKTLAYIESKDEGKVDMKQKLKQCYQKQVTINSPFAKKEIVKIWKRFSIKSFNKEVSGVSNALALKYSESQGRHYVAERDIKPGEMLMKDRPYAVICSEESRYQCCWYCLKSLANCIPCDYCKDVIFCSDKCKKEAWEEYHHVECKLFFHHFNLEAEDNEFLLAMMISAFRFLVLAINEYGSIQKLREAFSESKLLSSEPRTKGFVDGRLQSDKYAGFINLASAHDYILTDKVTFIVMLLMKRVAVHTTLFGNKNHLIPGKLIDDVDFVFATDIFKKHMIIMIVNHSNAIRSLSWTVDIRMTCLSIPGSLFNHSCVPNAFIVQSKEFSKVVAQLPIKKGEQVFLNYMGNKPYNTKYRQNFLRDSYKFHCNCIACTNNWPLLNQYPEISEQHEKYLPLTVCYQEAAQMCSLLMGDDCSDISHHFRKNYKYIKDTLTKISEAIVKLDTNAPQPCKELFSLQWCLFRFCMKLHSAFM